MSIDKITSVNKKFSAQEIKKKLEAHLTYDDGPVDWKDVWSLVYMETTDTNLQISLTTSVFATAVRLGEEAKCMESLKEVFKFRAEVEVINRTVLENSEEYQNFLKQHFQVFLRENIKEHVQEVYVTTKKNLLKTVQEEVDNIYSTTKTTIQSNQDMLNGSFQKLSKMEDKTKALEKTLNKFNIRVDEITMVLSNLDLELDIKVPSHLQKTTPQVISSVTVYDGTPRSKTKTHWLILAHSLAVLQLVIVGSYNIPWMMILDTFIVLIFHMYVLINYRTLTDWRGPN
jgi:hypothetical protein